MKNNGEKKHWVFKKHTNDINNLINVAIYLKENKAGISVSERKQMYNDFKNSKIYNPRESNREEPIDAVSHKISELNYYMFGYSDTVEGKKKFVFSPLGNLFLSRLQDEDSLAKIFATMLFGIQFPHPASQPSQDCNLYPFRLIFTLLLDERLEGKLFNYEVYNFLIYLDKVTKPIYEKLVMDILESRKLSDDEKFKNLKTIESKIVKSTYEWQYYVVPILTSIGVLEKDNGDNFVVLTHPQKSGSKSAPTRRRINNGFIILSKKVKELVEALFKSYSLYDVPLKLGNSKRRSNDIVKEIYSFYPDELLYILGEKPDRFQSRLLKLPKLIEEYAANPENNTADKFEDILEEAFNMFVNVEAQKLSGAGQTDIECLYLTLKEKFAVEAKSTSTKLNQVNAGRLRRHRKLIGANYTIVVTPRYVPSVSYDIEGEEIVIIKANTLSEYLYNNIIANRRDIDYKEIQTIIINNLGKDISSEVSDLTLTLFG